MELQNKGRLAIIGRYEGDTNPEAIEFVEFGKIPRYFREITVTEKLNGTNGAIHVPEDDNLPLVAQSRTRLLLPPSVSGKKDTDNFGFAAWVQGHEAVLRSFLGPGLHFGEWYGRGIQQGYGLDHKRFALFNTGRWRRWPEGEYLAGSGPTSIGPEAFVVGLDCVEVLYQGDHNTFAINAVVTDLKLDGSKQVAGQPAEGVIIYHQASRQYYKITCENDQDPKSIVAASRQLATR